jgi:hypothetical protein
MRNRLRLGPGVPLPAVEEPEPPEMGLPEVPTHSPFYSGEVAPGETVTHTVTVDTQGEARFYLRSEGGALTFRLIDPLGRKIDEETASEHGEYFDLGLAGAQSYLVDWANPGAWKVVVGRPADASGATRFAGYAALTSPLRLSIGTAPARAGEGEPVAITASLRHGQQPVPQAKVVAEIGRPDMQSDPLVLFDDGEHGDGAPRDGVYGATYRPPGLGGYYTLFVTAEGTFEGVDFAQTTEQLFSVSPATASLTGSYAEEAEDADRDGDFEVLALQVGLDVRVDGGYLLAATLVDGGGREIARVVAPLALSAGRQTATLRFPGQAVAQARADGPFNVKRLMLLDEAGAALPLQEATDVLTTRPYRYQDFEGS